MEIVILRELITTAIAMLTVLAPNHLLEINATNAGGWIKTDMTQSPNVSARRLSSLNIVPKNVRLAYQRCAHYTNKIVKPIMIAGEHHLQIHNSFLPP